MDSTAGMACQSGSHFLPGSAGPYLGLTWAVHLLWQQVALQQQCLPHWLFLGLDSTMNVHTLMFVSGVAGPW